MPPRRSLGAGAPPVLIADPAASKLCGPPGQGCFPRAPIQRRTPTTDLGGGRTRTTFDKSQAPGSSALPIGAVCREAATRHREHLRDQTLSFPLGARPWELWQEKRHRENQEGTRLFSSKKEWLWALGHQSDSLVLAVLKPGGFVTLALCRPRSEWPMGY